MRPTTMNLLVASSLVLFLHFSTSVSSLSVIDCDFETSTCGWADVNGNSWFRTNSTSISPGRDHTCSGSFRPSPFRKCGYWLSSIPSSNYTGTQEFSVVSPLISPTSRPSCLRFWYHFFGLEKAQFDVKINSQKNTFNARVLWTKLTPQSNNWVQGYVDIPRQYSSFYILYHAQLTAKYHDSVGVDDITLSYGPCPATPFVDLESGLEGWTASRNTLLTNGTPIFDHTTQSNLGHYILNQGNGQQSVISASIKNITSTFTNNYYSYCFKLWYFFIYQRTSGDTESYILLNVTNYPYRYTKKLTVQDAYSDALVNKWEPLSFTIPNPRRRYLTQDPLMTITLYGKGSTQIAIDDLLVSDSDCETMGECDFESDFCSWSNTGQFLWLRNTGGNTATLKKSPPYDTTTHTINGWYAMVPLEYIKSYYQATLQSPPLYARYGYGCLSFNYWAVGSAGTPAMYVTFYDLTKFNQPVTHVTLNASLTSMWQRFHYTLSKLPIRYSIKISTAYSARGLSSDLAIDDISLSTSACQGDRPVTVKTTPVPYAERAWDCNFEYSCGGWSFDKSRWIRTSYRKAPLSLNAPRSDHTLKTPEGQYLLYMPSSQPQNQNQVISIVNSTVLSDKQHCLSFWYFDTTEILFTLSVYLRSKHFATIPRVVSPSVASRSWKMVKADIWPYYPNAYIQLNFTTNSLLNGSFAIDDIKVVPGACRHVDDYVYTFDSMDNIEITRVAPLNGFMGTIHYPADRSYPKAPVRDHTSGTGSYFLFMNRATDFNTTYKDQLIISDLPAMHYTPELTNERCFRFAYQIYGNATLNVFLSQINSNSYFYPIFTTFAYHTNWVVTQVPYRAYYEHKLVFEMSKPFDTSSYVALDDISISSHNCKRSVECDFDDDICAYSSRYYKTDYDFSRFVGPPSNASWPGPPFDHTKRGYAGGYLSMSGYPSTVDRTRYSSVQSPIETYQYSMSSNYCISFWTQLTAPDAELTFTLGLYGGRGMAQNVPTTKMVDLVTLTNLTQSKWTWYSMDVDRKLFANYHEFNLQISGTTTKAKTVIALDDIELAMSSCEFGYKFKCGDGTIIGADKMCNFKKDCSDNSDEANCGECNFESGMCGWRTPSSSGYSLSGRWTTYSTSSGLGPKTDGNGNANGHYLLLRKSYSSGINSIFIAGTELSRDYRDFKTQYKDSYLTCTMTFDYYLYSSRTGYSAAVLEVLAGSDSDSAVLKGYYSTKSNSWQKGLVYVGGFSGSFVVKFMGSRFVVNETLALDNIQFHNCSFPDPIGPKASCPASTEVMCQDSRICIDRGDLCDFEDNCGTNWDENYAMCSSSANPGVPPNCAFEQSLEFCGITMETDQSAPLFNWQLMKGYDYYFIGYHGPGSDHTTKDRNGQFLTLRTYNKKYIGTNVRLYSPFMYSKGGPCWMRFFYFNNGNASLGTFNQLRVWVQYADGSNSDSATLFSTNSYIANWIKAKVKYSSSDAFRFVFDAQLANIRDSISLDDVSYTSTCIASPNSKRTPGSHSAALTVILVLLLVGIVGGVGFFLFRKHQSGQLSPYIDRVSSMLPGKAKSPGPAATTVVNVNYSDTPSTSTAE